MPIKCENCKSYASVETQEGTVERCLSPEVIQRSDRDFVFLNKLVEIGPAREICDKEGDGIFVFFEPKEPAAGAAATYVHNGKALAAVAGGGVR